MRVLGTSRVEVAVRLLSRCDDGNHLVAILIDRLTVDFGVWVSLHQIRCTFERLVGVGIVERIAHRHLKRLAGVFNVLGSLLEVLVAML